MKRLNKKQENWLKYSTYHYANINKRKDIISTNFYTYKEACDKIDIDMYE